MLARLWAPLPLPQPRRQGGWRQRLAADTGDFAQGPEPQISQLFGNHLLDWADGLLSAKRLQYLANCGVRDGFHHPMLTRLADLRPNQHAQQSLLRLLDTCDIGTRLSEFPGEFANHVMLPSSWLRLLMSYPHEYRLRLGADRRKLAAFWQGFMPRNPEVAAAHPIVGGMSSAELETVIPLTLHADAGPFTRTKACYVVSFSSLLCTGDAALTKFPRASYVQSSGAAKDQAFWGR
eukprot:10389327-Alexandrium_andersonii.AAC.1